MVTTEADNRERRSTTLAEIRRLEALSARAWPTEKEFYDGVWACRSTENIPSARINSVTPLDPDDNKISKKGLNIYVLITASIKGRCD
ncbi:hypothetical protein BBC0244_006520 [Bartonella apihabitans]|nr:hypothetical protein BBC0244_006520 [Bartonella apihabitans]